MKYDNVKLLLENKIVSKSRETLKYFNEFRVFLLNKVLHIPIHLYFLPSLFSLSSHFSLISERTVPQTHQLSSIRKQSCMKVIRKMLSHKDEGCINHSKKNLSSHLNESFDNENNKNNSNKNNNNKFKRCFKRNLNSSGKAL